MYAFKLGEGDRILSVTFDKFGTPDMPRKESLPEGNVSDYKMINGEFVYDPIPVETPVVEPTIEERISELEEALELILSGVTE